MAATSTPGRSLHALQTLAVGPSDRLLEVGCGRGTMVALICEKLIDGRITAIDRSAAMIRIAERTNRRHIAAGRAVLRAVALDALDPGPERFDKIFAINVSLFWLGPAAKELDLIRRSLTPEGAFYLFYEQPGPARTRAIAEKAAAALGEHGLVVATTAITEAGRTELCIEARAR